MAVEPPRVCRIAAMKQRRFRALLTLAGLIAIGCKGSLVAGRYRIEQTGNSMGEGAERIELNLRQDKSFDVTAGQMQMLKGTWSTDANTLTLSANQGRIGTSYRIEGAKLIPLAGEKEMTAWRWLRKPE